ncbi:putative glycosidase C21B10.07 [Venturia nashicola]|uniref:Putative glycosidase C21B10.07 n=1 Tax=Venturia nashicola TaxID=86259 RepID=A0A4Z1P0C3_9PEZI|nr:putative glycosidase C21B10.07 [Venturia nashicola]
MVLIEKSLINDCKVGEIANSCTTFLDVIEIPLIDLGGDQPGDHRSLLNALLADSNLISYPGVYVARKSPPSIFPVTGRVALQICLLARGVEASQSKAKLQVERIVVPGRTAFKFDTTRGYLKTQGFVGYLDRDNATASGLTVPSPDGQGVKIGVDHTNTIFIDKSVEALAPPNNNWYNQAFGRPSVKLFSTQTYTRGLFVFDVQHMPVGCGVWPALWTTHDEGWPLDGEFDVVEVSNNDPFNKMTLHTNSNKSPFTLSGTYETEVLLGNNCSAGGYRLTLRSCACDCLGSLMAVMVSRSLPWLLS